MCPSAISKPQQRGGLGPQGQSSHGKDKVQLLTCGGPRNCLVKKEFSCVNRVGTNDGSHTINPPVRRYMKVSTAMPGTLIKNKYHFSNLTAQILRLQFLDNSFPACSYIITGTNQSSRNTKMSVVHRSAWIRARQSFTISGQFIPVGFLHTQRRTKNPFNTQQYLYFTDQLISELNILLHFDGLYSANFEYSGYIHTRLSSKLLLLKQF